MSDALKAMIELIRQDKRTTWIAVVVIALLGGGKALTDYGIEPWGTSVSGVGGLIAGAVLLFSKLSKKPDEPPPQEPPGVL